MNTEGIPLANRGSGIWEAGDETVRGLPQRGYEESYRNRAESVGSNASREELPRADYNQSNQVPYRQSYPGANSGASHQPDSYDSGYQQSYDNHYEGYGYRGQPASNQQHHY
jgi:hypothetical protein